MFNIYYYCTNIVDVVEYVLMIQQVVVCVVFQPQQPCPSILTEVVPAQVFPSANTPPLRTT